MVRIQSRLELSLLRAMVGQFLENVRFHKRMSFRKNYSFMTNSTKKTQDPRGLKRNRTRVGISRATKVWTDLL